MLPARQALARGTRSASDRMPLGLQLTDAFAKTVICAGVNRLELLRIGDTLALHLHAESLTVLAVHLLEPLCDARLPQLQT